jgi:5-methylthioadenosine/S-adenosylhomocysteine deaminase
MGTQAHQNQLKGKHMKTRIEHVTLLTMNPTRDVLYDASVTIENDRIVAINQEGPVDSIMDGKQGILMPGMINVHTHLPMIPFRSLQDDRPDRLRNFLFPLEQEAMDEALIVASARYGAAESLLCGVTTVMDMYYFPDQCAEVYEEMGIRALVGATIIDQKTPDAQNEEEGFNVAQNFVEKWLRHPRIKPVMAPHGTHTVSEAMLKRISKYAHEKDILCTLHASEMLYEMDYFKEHHQSSPIEFLHQINFLNEKTLLAHAIYAQGNDFKLIQESKARVAHCVGANTKAAKGIAPIKTMRDHGIPVGLGTDGPSSGNTLDLFIQMNLAAKFHKVSNLDRSLFKAHELVSMVTIEGAQVLHLDHEVGSIELGKKADLVLVETDSVSMFPIHDPYSVLVYSAHAGHVKSVWVDGQCLVQDKQLTQHSLSQIRRDLSKQMTEFNAQAKRISESLPKV